MALLEFFGDTCPHCISMKPMIMNVEKKLGITIEKIEVWNNDENAKRLMAIDKGLCGGVPFFYNEEAKTFICGASDEETVTRWAKGEKGEGIGILK
jgi:thiol-disulfide isomerase/thioredoxin